jgi:hypothetical protein
MNRHIKICCTGIIACITSLGWLRPEELHAAEKAAFNKADRERFCVTVWAKITRMQIDEPFDVTLRVVNATEKPQSFQVMEAGWDVHWKNSNARIVWAGGVLGTSTGNTAVRIRLEPGEAYEKHVQMVVVQDGPPPVTTSFQMGFTPKGEKKTYWSNKVILGIKPGERK